VILPCGKAHEKNGRKQPFRLLSTFERDEAVGQNHREIGKNLFAGALVRVNLVLGSSRQDLLLAPVGDFRERFGANKSVKGILVIPL